MENPATWGQVERVIAEALEEAEVARRNGVIGLSVIRQVADALRKHDLLRDHERSQFSCKTCGEIMDIMQSCPQCGKVMLVRCPNCHPSLRVVNVE